MKEAVAQADFRFRDDSDVELPLVRIPHPHVLVSEDVANGSPMIEGTRVPVRRLFSWHRGGASVERLVRRYPQIAPALIFDALAFAYDNLELITADIVRERAALDRERVVLDAERQR